MLTCVFCRNEINPKEKKLIVLSRGSFNTSAIISYGPHLSKSFPKWLRFPICKNCENIRSKTIKKDSLGKQLIPEYGVDEEYTQVTKFYNYVEFISTSKNFHFLVKCLDTLKKLSDDELALYLNVVGINVDVFFIKKFMNDYQ